MFDGGLLSTYRTKGPPDLPELCVSPKLCVILVPLHTAIQNRTCAHPSLLSITKSLWEVFALVRKLKDVLYLVRLGHSFFVKPLPLHAKNRRPITIRHGNISNLELISSSIHHLMKSFIVYAGATRTVTKRKTSPPRLLTSHLLPQLPTAIKAPSLQFLYENISNRKLISSLLQLLIQAWEAFL